MSTKKREKSANKTRVGLAFQGGSLLAGAVDAGVIRAFVEADVFDTYDVTAFSGTSAGAVVASVCWGLTLEGCISKAADVLEEQWIRNANGIIPSQEWGDLYKNVDKVFRFNPIYDRLANNYRTPTLRAMFRDWLETYIDAESYVDKFYNQFRDQKKADWQVDQSAPRLALGSADVLEGEVVTFFDVNFATTVDTYLKKHPNDPDGEANAIKAGAGFMIEALMASGSLDEVNGMTTISNGPRKGTYLDGAWGQNPPINEMIDFGVDQIWIIEIFPKFRPRLPESYGEREDRKEELWQNSLVEHELHMIEKVNEWLRSGRLIGDYEKYVQCYRPSLPNGQEAQDEGKGKIQSENANENSEDIEKGSIRQADFREYRQIHTERMPMTLDFTPGARIVNSESFLRDKMNYGYENAKHFLRRIA